MVRKTAVVLIPFLSGLISNATVLQGCNTVAVLIPFLSGLISNLGDMLQAAIEDCLNPLSVGSHF